MELLDFAASHLPGVLRLNEAEGWPSLPANPRRAQAALTAPGVVCVVAVDKGIVVGYIHVLTDRAITAYVSTIAVAAERRREGIGRQLIREEAQRAGVNRLDLLTDVVSEEFYRTFEHRTLSGFRIYPEVPSHA